GGIRLGKPARFKHLIQRIGQAQLGLTLGGVWESKISEYVSGPTDYRFSPISAFACHSVLRDPSLLFSIVQRRDRHPVWPSGRRTETSSGTRAARTRLSRTERCTRLDTRFRRATRRPPGRQDQAPSKASPSAQYRRTARYPERCPCPP